ncbi:phosphatase PAP2 family protein [Acinetobacter cumulans]|uniref:undecaprenyl-diphosphate phosphatase n=1 Tax=Acinetobacter cumulans TaxID=2136182 RepID=A0A3A8G1V5_9GAMM|nr:phosphatase PAP2 family protein [Acinetobacter cumulans]RKG52469.1 phosphatase PAP2 family protein [Acinetobacter cumulans]
MKFKNAKIRMLDLDLKGCIYLNTFSHSERIAYFFKMISRLGDGIFWYLMLMAVWMLQGLMYAFQLLYIALSGLLGTGIYKLLKQKTVRPRPYQVHQVIRLGERPLDHFSFPSGHTLHAVMVTTVLGWVQPILLILMLPFTVLVALSRMVLGLHYPSDVVIGALIGAVVAIAIILCAPVLHIML